MDFTDQYLWWQSGNRTEDQIELVVPNHISLGCTTCVSGPLSPSPSPPPPPPPSRACLIELPVILFMALSGVHMNEAAIPLLSLKLCGGVGEGRGRGKMYYKACQLYHCTVWLHGVCECVEGGCTSVLECDYNLLPIFLSHILLRVCIIVSPDTFQCVHSSHLALEFFCTYSPSMCNWQSGAISVTIPTCTVQGRALCGVLVNCINVVSS